MTIMDVDASGASYYGEQALHHISADGQSSMVQLGNQTTVLMPLLCFVWSAGIMHTCTSLAAFFLL